jgi:hypothetical protein
MEIQSTPNRLEEYSCPGALETLSVKDLVALILDVDSAAEIRHVLVFCKGSSAPLRAHRNPFYGSEANPAEDRRLSGSLGKEWVCEPSSSGWEPRC